MVSQRIMAVIWLANPKTTKTEYVSTLTAPTQALNIKLFRELINGMENILPGFEEIEPGNKALVA